MHGKRPTQDTGTWDAEQPAPRRRVARYGVPVAVAGVAAATIGLVPAFAGSGDPDLPPVTAEELLTKIAKSDVERFSGSVRITTDLGLPGLPGGGSAGGMFGPGGDRGRDGGEEGEGGAATAPGEKLMELASGSHTLRVAADGPERQKVSIVEDAAEYSLVRNGDEVWAYDSGSNTAYHAEKDGSRHHERSRERPGVPEELRDATPRELAREILKATDDTTSVTVDGTANVAGRQAYELLVEPEQKQSTVGSVRIAVDADTGMPLKVTVTPRSGGKAAIDAGFTSVDFGKPKAGTFDFDPPKGAKVVEESDLERHRSEHRSDRHADGRHSDGRGPGSWKHRQHEGAANAAGPEVIGEGWTAVVRIEAPEGKAGAPGRGDREKEMPREARKFLDGLGDEVSGKFGSGTVFSTRMVNALLTEDGDVYVGAVTKGALVKAAESAR